jgi:hypothetical protein
MPTGTCINCISPGSLSATLALIVIGAGIAFTVERRKLTRLLDCVAANIGQTKRPPEGGLSVAVMVMQNQATFSAPFFRRYAMKPSPTKPRCE